MMFEKDGEVGWTVRSEEEEEKSFPLRETVVHYEEKDGVPGKHREGRVVCACTMQNIS